MKKLNKITTISICLMLTVIAVSAQTAMIRPSLNPMLAREKAEKDSPGSVAVVPNTKTASNFKKKFGQASDASWERDKEGMMVCWFTMNNIAHRAFYNNRGKLLYTVFGYPGEKLDKAIYNQVKSVYYNANIVYVNEIDRPGETTIYLIELNDDKYISKLRVEGSDMQITQQFLEH